MDNLLIEILQKQTGKSDAEIKELMFEEKEGQQVLKSDAK